MKRLSGILLMGLMMFAVSCKPEFEAINYGQEACAQCKMTILDKRYAAELVTGKGRVYKFDDLACLRRFLTEERIPEAGMKVFVASYQNPGGPFLDATQAVYLHNDYFKTPMNGDIAAFATANDARPLGDSLNAGPARWEKLQ